MRSRRFSIPDCRGPLPQPCALLILMAALGVPGCYTASLATDTDEGMWSVAELQHAHVGEEVQFSLVLRERLREGRVSLLGVADYAAVHIEDQRIEANARGDRFQFSHTLKELTLGRIVLVTAEAYLMRGRKDFMQIQGRWQRSQSPYEQPDKRIAGDSVKLQVYQSEIDHTIDAPQTELDPATARLVITAREERISTVLAARPGRPGFILTGPDQAGRYRMQYAPKADQVNRTGNTSATLFVLDRNGQQHSFAIEFETP